MVNDQIAQLLRQKGDSTCIQKAESLENENAGLRNLHLRNLGLDEKDIAGIANILEQETNSTTIKSISFSHNQGIGDVGATLLANKIPHSIREIGLVDCGISDKGGSEILHWMRKSTHLQMICMEQNDFSDELRMEFSNFKREHPNVLVVY